MSHLHFNLLISIAVLVNELKQTHFYCLQFCFCTKLTQWCTRTLQLQQRMATPSTAKYKVIPDLLAAQPMSTQLEKVWKLLKMHASCWSDCQMNNAIKDLLST